MTLDNLLEAPKKKVEAYLNEVSYADDANYVPSLFAIEFVNFIKLVNGSGGEENITPVLHYRMLDTLASSESNCANMLFRGAAKTTVFAEYLFLYLATYGELPDFGRVDLAIYVSDSMENGVKNLRKNLEYRYSESEFLKEYVPEAKFTDSRWEFVNADGKRLIIKGYGAKALSLDTELHTLNGRTTIGECQVGDQIFGADGKLTTITAKSEIFHKPMYRISLSDGRSLEVSEDHLNPVVINTNPNNIARWEEHVLTTKDLLQQPLIHTKKGNLKHQGTSSKSLVAVKNIEPLQYPEAQLPIDPYTLGVVIGDGRIRKECGSVELTVHKDELSHYHTTIPYEFGSLYVDPRSNAVTQSIHGLGKYLKEMELNVREEYKFIPYEYFVGSVEQRLALLRGLMDTDGTVSETGRLSFTSSSHQLCDDLACLVRSLGGTAGQIREHSKTSAYRVELWMKMNPFLLARKASRFVPKTKHVAVTSIVRIADAPSQCIAVDNEERQFVAECYFRTHNTGVRGTKELGKRPQLAVLDDLVSDEDARSATVIATIEDTVYKAIDHALHPTRRKTIWNGTPFNMRDPLYKAIESGAWKVNVFPVCERFPCSREEFRGAWEDRFTYDAVMAAYVKAVRVGRVDAFMQELMLRIMSDEERVILDSEIRWYSRTALLKQQSAYNFYITTDFATSAKEKADYAVVSVWAINSAGWWFWVDGVCKQQLMDKTLDDVFAFAQMYRPLEVGFETNGQQGGFIPLIQRKMLTDNVWFNIAKARNSKELGFRSESDKTTRFMQIAPAIKAGHVLFPKEMENHPAMIEMKEELSLFTRGGFKSRHDDFADTISMLNNFDPIKPSGETVNMTKTKDGYWAPDIEEEEVHTKDGYIV